jgi:hypothetical protein
VSPYDQALCFLAFIGIFWVVVALMLVRRLDRYERDIAEQKRHPAE